MEVVANGHIRLGNTYSSLNDYNSALAHYCKAENIIRSISKEDINDASLFNHIGFIYYCLEDYVSAQEYLGKALDININMLGTDHPQTQKIASIINEIKIKQSQTKG